MKYLIIEDEQLAALEMTRLLKEIEPTAEIMEMLPSVKRSVEWLNKNPQPDLIFMDIHLQDGICFEIFDRTEVKAPVIFTTAYDQYALQAFRSNGVAYLLKPIDENDVRTALERLGNFAAEHQRESVSRIVSEMLSHNNKPQYSTRLTVKAGESYITIQMENIAFFYSEDHYTYVCTKQNKRYIVDGSLDEWEKRLDPTQFFHATRNCIVSIDGVDRVNKFFNGRLKLHTRPEYEGEFYISRLKVREFLAWLGNE